MADISKVKIGNDTYDLKDSTARSGLNDKQDIIQKTTLPTASATEEGNIYQYIGATGGGLTNGFFYKCIKNGNTYSWTAIDFGGQDISGKADKVSPVITGDFAGLDANGNLTDSGKKASDFAAASHTHTKSQITDFPALGTAAAKNVPASGNAATTEVVMGNDSRLSDARTPTSHTHTKSQITDFPTLGTAAAKDVATSGNASSTQVVMGNDSRLSDARTPTSHTHTKSQITDFPTSLPASDTTSSYSATGTAPVNGTAVAAALGTLDVSSVGGSGKYIQAISETDGKISATAANMPTSLPASDVYSWAKASTKPSYTASEVGAIATSAKGAASGVAELDSAGKVPSSQLPSFVDDVLEYDAKASFPTTGEAGKIYVDKTTNLTWRWSGTTYVEISPSLALGETSSTAYRGDRGKTAYTHATDSNRLTTAKSEGLYKIATTAEGHVKSVTAVAKSDITGLGIPAQDTTYSAATQSAAGLMSAADKTKLDGVATGAEVNQNAFSNVVVGSTTIAADGKTDTLTLVAGSNVTLTPDATNDKVTIAATDTTYSAATQSAAGLMSATDKTKLDGIASGAQVNTVMSVAGKTGAVTLSASDVGLGNVGNFKAVSTVASQGLTSTEQSNARANIGAGTSSLTIGTTGSTAAAGNHSHSAATTSAAGFMSATDKSKLDGIAEGATANTGTVTQVKVGSTAYNPSSGVVSLPAYPTTLPASDVSAWAKASTKPTYTASEVGAAASSHNQASNTINAMTGYSKPSSTSAIATTDTLNGAIGKLEKALDGKGTSNFSGAYNDLTGKPTLGTAAAKDVPSSGNASTSQVVMGNDSRLSDARTPTSHTHTKSQITDFPSSLPASNTTDTYSSTGTAPVSGKAVAEALGTIINDSAVTSTSTYSSNKVEALINEVAPSKIDVEGVTTKFEKSGSAQQVEFKFMFTKSASGNTWTDGDNIYYSNGTIQYVLDKTTSTWSAKIWSGLSSFNGTGIWSDGDNTYYSYGTTQYVLDQSTSTWSAKTWTGLTDFFGSGIWIDGDNIYYSFGSDQYVLDKTTSTWSAKTWTGLTNFYGSDVWTDGANMNYSMGTTHYVLTRTNSRWSAKTWSGLSNFDGRYIWTDGNNIYYSYGTTQYVKSNTGNAWSAKTWSGLSSFYGTDIWTDGDNIYYSNDITQCVLDKTTSTWYNKTFFSIPILHGYNVWTDGDNIYAFCDNSHYILDKATFIWLTKTWIGVINDKLNGRSIWTNGYNIYCSNGTAQYILDKSTSTWSAKAWTGLTDFGGYNVWADGNNIYYSFGSGQYVLDQSTSTWSTKTWTGLTNFYGYYIWTDGNNIYYSYGTTQYVLDKSTSTWSTKTWTGLTNFNGSDIWTDGNNIYYSYGTTQYVLDKSTSTWSTKTWTGLTNFNGSDIWTNGDNIYHSGKTTTYKLTPKPAIKSVHLR